MSYSRSQGKSATKEDRVVDLFQRIQEDVESGSGENVGKNTDNTDTFVLFVGEKDAGKSSLIQQFLGKDSEVRGRVE